MPRNGSGVMSKPAGTTAVPNTTIESAKYNATIDDIIQDLNNARPVVAGGTGGATAVAGGDNLSTKGADIASAATTDIGASTGRYVHITGTTTITSLGTKTAGVLRVLTFDGALTLTHNATSLILPYAANILTAAGDVAVFVSEGGGNWRCVSFSNAGDAVVDYLKGLITTRASATQVSVAAGQIKGSNRFVKNTGTIAKNINAAWASGTGVGGMESGFTVAASLTYHLHALRKISDGSFDWIYSPNLTITTMPSGYEWVGRFWSVYTNASSQIFDYVQVDNTCLMASTLWFSTASGLSFAVSTVPVAVPLPGGIRTNALLVLTSSLSGAGGFTITITNGDDATGGAGSGVSCQASNTAGASNAASRGTATTNTTRQLGRSTAGGGAAATANIGGWEDYTLPRVA